MALAQADYHYILPAIPFLVGLIAWNKKILTLGGAVAGFIIGSIIVMTGVAESLALFTFFFLGSISTKVSKRILSSKTKEKASKGFKVVSYEKESNEKKGRNALQVFATAGVPAILCSMLKLSSEENKFALTSYYFAFFACNLADTLASEFGVLSKAEPILVTTFKKVPRGTDGAISFEGTLFSLIGGLIIGITAIFHDDLVSNSSFPLIITRYALIGFIGCMFDSILGALIQTKSRIIKNPNSWKTLNCLVNVLSGLLTLTADTIFQKYEYESILVTSAIASFVLLFISPISRFLARKLLHIGISIVVLTASSVFNLRKLISIVGLVVSFLALPQLRLDMLWLRFNKYETNTETVKDSGIFLYALVTGFMFYNFETKDAEAILLPMYLSDSIGSIVGYYLGKNTENSKKAIVSKTIYGSFAFFIVQLLIQSLLKPNDIVGNLALSSNLALIELLTGSLDNLLLPVGYVLFNGMSTDYSSLMIFTISGILCHFVLFGNKFSGCKQGFHAFYRFSRPHTIIGTTLSCTVIMMLTLFNSLSIEEVKKYESVITFGYFITVASSLQANIYIVGLNQLYDVEIDIINKPYLPIASGEFTPSFSNSLVFFCLLGSMCNAYYFGNLELLYTVVLGNIMGTIYSVDLPYMHWKRFPLLAASLIFMVRGGVIQIGFAEFSKNLIEANTPYTLQSTFDNKYIMFLTVFLTVFGVAIAMFKDVPDIAGDEKEGIRTFAVKFGAQRIVHFVNFMLGTVYSMAALYWYQEQHLVGCFGHLLVFAWLGNKLNNTIVEGKEAAVSIRGSYMSIWKAFYAEYILIGLMFLQNKA